MGKGKALRRTSWAEKHALLTAYYDEEWGMPVTDERGVFERIALETFQSGLSWLTVLSKREALREAFGNFCPETIAAFTDDNIEALIVNEKIIRNRRKIVATVANAKATIAMRGGEDHDLPTLVWSFMPERSPSTDDEATLPTTSPESAMLAQALKQRGFTMVGPTTMFAVMSAIGMVDLHVRSSHRRGCSGLWGIDGERLKRA